MRLHYVTLLLILALAGCGSEAATETAPPRLYLAGDGELWVVDVAAPSARHVAIEDLGPGDPPHRVIARRDRLVLYGAQTFTVDGDLAGRRTLTPGRSFALPSARPDRLWVVRLEPGRWHVRAIREITLDGTVTVDDARPPGGYWPVAAVGDGLLVDDHKDDLALWDPRTDTVVRRLAIDPGRFGAAGGDFVASCADEPCRTLRLTDTRSGASSTVPAPDGTRFEPWNAAFSPAGDMLGVPVQERGDTRRLALIDVETGALTSVPDAQVPAGYTFVVWSPAGDHVFITGGERFHRRTLVGYRLGAPRAHPIDVEVGDFYGAAAL